MIKKFLSVAIILFGVHSIALGAEVTELTSSFQKGNPFDFHFTAGYSYKLSRGAIKREGAGDDSSANSLQLLKESRYSRVQHFLNLRAEFGLWKNLQFHIALPIVLRDSRTLSFTQNGGDSCIAPDGKPLCVNRDNSTLVKDGFLDRDALGADVIEWGSASPPSGGLHLPYRSGLDQLYLGLSWAPISQLDDETKPTFVVGFEARIAVGEEMRYNRKAYEGTAINDSRAQSNTAAGQGVHQLHWYFNVSRRFNEYIDPWFGMGYLLPIAASGSLYDQTTFDGSGQRRSGPQHVGSFETGVEIIPWEEPEKRNKFSIELRFKMTGFFEGRGYSPLWEVFANSDILAGQCLADPTSTSTVQTWDNGTYCDSAHGGENDIINYPGITNIENYINFGARLAFNLYLTKYFFGQMGIGISHDMAHFITYADAGIPAADGKVHQDDPKLVNPVYRPTIDATGRRFRVDEATVFDFFINLTGQF